MKVRMKRRPSGLYNGTAWPAAGEVTDLPDALAASLLSDGTAEAVELEPELVPEPTPTHTPTPNPEPTPPGTEETATPPTGDEETATPPADAETATPPTGDVETATPRRSRARRG